MYPTWNLVRARYPSASLVFVWGDGVEFHMNGHRYLATFNDSETAIVKVDRIT